MADFKYCYRDVTYDDNDFVCIANVSYIDIFNGEQLAYIHVNADDPKECDRGLMLYESENHFIVQDATYSEDVEAILTDFRRNYEGIQISLYVHDVIDVTIPLSLYAISDVMDIIDIVSYNTPDDILIGITYDKLLPKFEFFV